MEDETLIKFYLHLIWQIRSDSPVIQPEDKADLYKFMEHVLEKNDCLPIVINGTENHVHLLVNFTVTQTISKVVGKIKRESSVWLSKKDAKYKNFHWQSGYGAFSISEESLQNMMLYIHNQEELHLKYSFEEEFRSILDWNHVEYDERYLFCD